MLTFINTLLILTIFLFNPVTAIQSFLIYCLALICFAKIHRGLFFIIIACCCFISIFFFKIADFLSSYQNNLFIIFKHLLTENHNFGYYLIKNNFLHLYLRDGSIAIIGLIFFILALKTRLKLLKIKNKIIIKENPSQENINLGTVVNNKKNFTLSDFELNQHALILGTTGSGKTTTLLNIVSSCLLRKIPLIYLDGKGSSSLVEKLIKLSKKTNTTLKIFALNPHVIPEEYLCHYNPFAFGNFTEWKNKILTLMLDAETRGQEYYAFQAESYIGILCEVLNRSKITVDLEAILGFMKNKEELQKLANRLDSDTAMRTATILKANSQNNFETILESFYYSYYGNLFSTSHLPKEKVINLEAAILNGELILFLLDAASYKKDTNLLGRLIINDINSLFSKFGKDSYKKTSYCIFDEFAAYAAPNMASMLSLQRDNGLHAIIGTQSINAISMQSDNIKRVAVELIANCNTFIIHKINDPKDINLIVETIGTYEDKRHHSTTISDKSINITNIRDNQKDILSKQKIRTLAPGHGYVCCTLRSENPSLVKFYQIV